MCVVCCVVLCCFVGSPLVMKGKKLLVQRGAESISRTPVVLDRHILREVHHVIDDLIKRIGASPG